MTFDEWIVAAQTDSASIASSSLTWLRGLGRAVADVLFPPRCVGCHRFGSWLCDQCVDRIEFIRPPICSKCGLPVDDQNPRQAGRQDRGPWCGRCSAHPPSPDAMRAFGFHSGPLRRAIHGLKYEDLRVLAAPLGEMMARAWPDLSPHGQQADVVVPIPLHRTRRRERGYNQAELLAREVAARLGLPKCDDVLLRVRATADQVGLDADGRRANVLNAFQCATDGLAGRRVLLIDDVVTTGATLEAASHALRQGGAALVWAYTLARAR